jgi:hypothetical protein
VTIITFNDSYGASEVPFKARGARRQTSLLKLGNRMCQRLEKRCVTTSVFMYMYTYTYMNNNMYKQYICMRTYLCTLFSICNEIYWFPLRSGHPSLLMLNRGLQEPIT